MKSFHFSEPSLFDHVRNKFQHFPHKRVPGLNPTHMKAVEEIKRNGYTIIPGFIDHSKLEYIQKDLDQRFKNGNFSYPVLAQSKIEVIKDKDILDNFLYGSPSFFKERGLTFDQNDFQSYEQILKEFKPSTLGMEIPPENSTYSQLWLHPELLNIVEAYMGLRPQLLEAYVRRNFPSPYRTMNHYWHRDLNNKFYLLKVFIFFTDCTVETGPHEFISGSHKDFTLNSKRYYEDEEVEKTYPSQEGKCIQSIVKAGTVILEDTRGLHRAALPKKAYRDLGYAVFSPIPWYKKYKYSNYKISTSVFSSLTERQRSYIPQVNVN